MTVVIPEINALIEVSIFGGDSYRSRIEDAEGRRVTIAAPHGLKVSEVPQIGAKVTLRWSAGARGRYAAPGEVAEIVSGVLALWRVDITGPPEIQQQRSFVRGGGGEAFQLTPLDAEPDAKPARGRVIDLSEGGVRARLSWVELEAGAGAAVRITLDDDVIDLPATVLRVEKVEDSGPGAVELVALYEPSESQAQVIRRYIMRQQMLNRSRGR